MIHVTEQVPPAVTGIEALDELNRQRTRRRTLLAIPPQPDLVACSTGHGDDPLRRYWSVAFGVVERSGSGRITGTGCSVICPGVPEPQIIR
jgi:hypothetical protein